jgi:hypothetical protein
MKALNVSGPIRRPVADHLPGEQGEPRGRRRPETVVPFMSTARLRPFPFPLNPLNIYLLPPPPPPPPPPLSIFFFFFEIKCFTGGHREVRGGPKGGGRL